MPLTCASALWRCARAPYQHSLPCLLQVHAGIVRMCEKEDWHAIQQERGCANIAVEINRYIDSVMEVGGTDNPPSSLLAQASSGAVLVSVLLSLSGSPLCDISLLGITSSCYGLTTAMSMLVKSRPQITPRSAGPA